MGREAVATVHWNGDIAEVKLHLDSHHLSLRGNMRADFLRTQITEIAQSDEGVTLQADGVPVVLEFSLLDAERWVKALRKAPPTLAQKLGISAETPAYVLGDFEDDALSKALLDAQSTTPETAALFIAVIEDPPQLAAAEALAATAPDRHLWTVCRKGKAAPISSNDIRTFLRERGYRDSKSCAVSDTYTATLYRKPTA